MNKLRFRSGQVHLRKVPVAPETVVQPGDLLWLDESQAKPASSFTWAGSLAATQAAFAAKFLGIAHQASPAGDSSPISVDVSPHSVYEVDVSPAAYSLGQPLGPDELAGALMSTQLEAALAANAIARAAEFTIASTTTLRVTLASAFDTASSNVNAAIG